jgi:hypothetical protein
MFCGTASAGVAKRLLLCAEVNVDDDPLYMAFTVFPRPAEPRRFRQYGEPCQPKERYACPGQSPCACGD